MTGNVGPGTMPIDEDNLGNTHLFVLGEGNGSITTFTINQKTGALTRASAVTGLPTSSAGLVVK